MSENPITSVEESIPSAASANPNQNSGVVRLARYILNPGRREQGNPIFPTGATVVLKGPPLLPGDVVLQVITDTVEAFTDADSGNDTTLQIRFNDGTTQTDIQAAGSSIGAAPFSKVRRDLMIQDFATEGDWRRITLSTRVEVLVQAAAQNITAGLMYIYVLYASGVD